MKTVNVRYGGFEAEQEVDENLYDAIYQQGRADAIKDFLKETGKYIYYMDKYTDFEGQMISIENLNLIAEQIKEQKNE